MVRLHNRIFIRLDKTPELDGRPNWRTDRRTDRHPVAITAVCIEPLISGTDKITLYIQNRQLHGVDLQLSQCSWTMHLNQHYITDWPVATRHVTNTSRITLLLQDASTSTMRPLDITTITSALRTVLSRWAITSTVRPGKTTQLHANVTVPPELITTRFTCLLL